MRACFSVTVCMCMCTSAPSTQILHIGDYLLHGASTADYLQLRDGADGGAAANGVPSSAYRRAATSGLAGAGGGAPPLLLTQPSSGAAAGEPPLDLYLALDFAHLARLCYLRPLAGAEQMSLGLLSAPVNAASICFTIVVRKRERLSAGSHLTHPPRTLPAMPRTLPAMPRTLPAMPRSPLQTREPTIPFRRFPQPCCGHVPRSQVGMQTLLAWNKEAAKEALAVLRAAALPALLRHGGYLVRVARAGVAAACVGAHTTATPSSIPHTHTHAYQRV